MALSEKGLALALAKGGECSSVWHFDKGDLTVEYVQDAEPVIERNKVIREQPRDRRSDLRPLYSIPTTNYLAFLFEFEKRTGRQMKWWGGNDDEFEHFLWLKMRDPDNAHMRTDSKINTYINGCSLPLLGKG